MRPVDHIGSVAPGNRVRRPEDQRRQQDPRRKPPAKQEPDRPAPPGSDDRPHIIDELA